MAEKEECVKTRLAPQAQNVPNFLLLLIVLLLLKPATWRGHQESKSMSKKMITRAKKKDWAMRSMPPSPAADQKGTRPTQLAAVLAPPLSSPVSLWAAKFFLQFPRNSRGNWMRNRAPFIGKAEAKQKSRRE